MKNNKGKAFEIKVKENLKTCFPKAFIFRIPDQMTGYLTTSQNPCDFLLFTEKKLFLLECKSHEGNTIPFSAIPQYERLLRYKDYEDVYPFIIAWFIDHDKVIAVHIKEAEKMVNNGCKSINIKMLSENDYKIIDIPSVKLRTFLDSDYTILLKEAENFKN